MYSVIPNSKFDNNVCYEHQNYKLEKISNDIRTSLLIVKKYRIIPLGFEKIHIIYLQFFPRLNLRILALLHKETRLEITQTNLILISL